jgi:chromate transporter
MNVATFLGYTQFGIVGSLLTTVGFVTPSVLILSNLYKYINKYRMTPLVQSWLLYIKATVVGFISYALFNIIDIVILEDFDINAINYRMFIVFIILAIIYKFLAKYPWIVIIIGGVFGVLFL